MELDSFVRETLLKIQKGVKEANIAIAELEGVPVRTDGKMHFILNKNPNSKPEGGILFDIAVTVTSGQSAAAEGKISVVGLSLLGGKLSASDAQENVSRIKFKVDPFNDIF